jgi:uncharacterized protein YecE (DUF72 family)
LLDSSKPFIFYGFGSCPQIFIVSMARIFVGTSGFSYNDWRRVFYPATIRKSEMLEYYAARFPAVEVNSSFYTIPSPSVFKRMAGRTPSSFQFVVKVPKDLTHSHNITSEICERFSRSVQPLIDENKLGCLLVQYPWSFQRSSENIDRIRRLRKELSVFPLVIEFRNASWATDETFNLLRELEIGYCCVDEPDLPGLMPRLSVATSSIGYVRFHGRNAEKWWQHGSSWERYDYFYTPDELREWIPKVQALLNSTDKTFIFFNNHYQGSAPKNAALFAEMLGLKLVE